MKAFIVLILLGLNVSTVYAETYKWEDANGVHYSDNAASVPEKYRNKVFEETKAETSRYTPPSKADIQANQNTNSQARAEMERKAVAAILQQQQFINQVTLAQQKRVSDAMGQQQAKLITQNKKNTDGAIQSLARFMAIWVMIGLVVFITWVSTIIDIVRSEFTNPSNKTVWVMLVILLPLLGTVLYCFLGSGQKLNHISGQSREQAELLARLKPRDQDGKDFIL